MQRTYTSGTGKWGIVPSLPPWTDSLPSPQVETPSVSSVSFWIFGREICKFTTSCFWKSDYPLILSLRKKRSRNGPNAAGRFLLCNNPPWYIDIIQQPATSFRKIFPIYITEKRMHNQWATKCSLIWRYHLSVRIVSWLNSVSETDE